jgi:hypothetical protein
LQKKRGIEKVTYSRCSRLALISNMRLNSNQPFETIRRLGRHAMSQNMPLLSRFAVGLLASALGAVLLNSQLGRASDPAAHSVPASREMMQLLRDEHGQVADMLKAHLATERLAATRTKVGGR